jgi:hypothetical protein
MDIPINTSRYFFRFTYQEKIATKKPSWIIRRKLNKKGSDTD